MSAEILYHAGLTTSQWATLQSLALTCITMSNIGCCYILTRTLIQARKQNYRYGNPYIILQKDILLLWKKSLLFKSGYLSKNTSKPENAASEAFQVLNL